MPLKALLLAAAAALAAWLSPAVAGASSGEEAEAGPVSVVVKADAVRFTVRLLTDQTVVDYQFYELGEARRLLLDAAARNGKLTGAPATPATSFSPKASWDIPVSSGRGSPQSLSVVELYYPIKDGFDYLACAREVNALVNGIKVPEKAHFHYQIENMAFWVAAAEKSRPELLKRFADQLQAISAALGGKVKFNVSNLTTPVRQRPVNDTQVELSLDPVVTLEVF